MNPTPDPLPGQALFEQGLALMNKGYPDKGEPLLAEAARLGHPHAARLIVENRLATKVANLAHAGQRNLALACIEDARWQPLQPSAQLVTQLRQYLEQFQDGNLVQPPNAAGWLNMGVTLMGVDKFQEGMFCFRKAIELDLHLENAWLNLGLSLGKLKKYTDALLAFEKLLTIIPGSVHGWHLKGMVLANLERQAEAVTAYDEALKLNPQLAEAWYHKGLALGHLQKQEESIACCDRTLELNPRHLSALLQKGRALSRLGRDDEAKACGDEMNRIDPVATSQLLDAAIARGPQPGDN